MQEKGAYTQKDPPCQQTLCKEWMSPSGLAGECKEKVMMACMKGEIRHKSERGRLVFLLGVSWGGVSVVAIENIQDRTIGCKACFGGHWEALLVCSISTFAIEHTCLLGCVEGGLVDRWYLTQSSGLMEVWGMSYTDGKHRR